MTSTSFQLNFQTSSYEPSIFIAPLYKKLSKNVSSLFKTWNRRKHPLSANRYYCICMNDSLALGGGGNFALSLDGDLLSGTIGPCETFGNLCLAHSPEFELKNVELWGFIHSSCYTT
ncbi:hypothetical protein NL676_021380 [Syzygium grande]|nr:hypothetical protein NL676_021380 [Syzygium grande]